MSKFEGSLPQTRIVRRGGQEAVCSNAMSRFIVSRWPRDGSRWPIHENPGSNNAILGASAESPWPIDGSLGSYREGEG